jgi:hypothetical protein
MALEIRRATKRRARLRMNIEGQPGGGKTFSSILLAKFLIGEPLKIAGDVASKIVVVDTERSSAELYADEFDFGHIDLPDHNPRRYIEAIRAAESAGAEVIILDSITHEWKWCLAEVDRIKPKFSNNKWSAWSEVRPPHDDFIDAMMGCRAHLIATTRAKPATAQDKNDDGKTVIKKLGLEGIQDDMIEFAFGIVLRIDGEHNGIITKTRCRALDGKVFPLPGEALASEIRRWLDSGDPLIDVAHTLEDAIRQGVAAASVGSSIEEKRAAYKRAREGLILWCKGHGRSEDETKAALEDMKNRAGAAHKGTTPQAQPAAQAATAATDEATARAIDEGRA